MKVLTYLFVAILDGFLMSLVLWYGAQTAEQQDYLFVLFFYLAFVLVILMKIPVWTCIFRASIDEEREEERSRNFDRIYNKYYKNIRNTVHRCPICKESAVVNNCTICGDYYYCKKNRSARYIGNRKDIQWLR